MIARLASADSARHRKRVKNQYRAVQSCTKMTANRTIVVLRVPPKLLMLEMSALNRSV